MANERSTITVEEWMAELQRVTAKKGDNEGETTREIAKRTGHSLAWVRENIVRTAFEAGTLVVGEATVRRSDGKMGRTPVYRFLKPKKKKK